LNISSLDLKNSLKAYKTMKSILKTDVKFILGNRESIISCSEAELSIITDVDDYTAPVILTDETISLVEKCKLQDTVSITADEIKISARVINHTARTEEVNLWDSDKYREVAIVPAVEILKAIKTIKYAVGKAVERPVLNNIYWDAGNLVAVDGYRISVKTLSAATNQPILLTPMIYSLLEKLIEPKSKDMLKIYLEPEGQGAAFEFGDYLLCSNVGEGEFLKYQQLFTEECELEAEVDRKIFIDTLEFMTVEKNPLTLVIKEKLLELTTKTINHFISDTLEIESTRFKTPLVINFIPKYLIEPLKNIEDDVVNLRFTTGLKPCIITHSKGKDLILPFRINN
jgi:DNA polymerase III sliding clamp (beta) subunit (PCNA family)